MTTTEEKLLLFFHYLKPYIDKGLIQFDSELRKQSEDKLNELLKSDKNKKLELLDIVNILTAFIELDKIEKEYAPTITLLILKTQDEGADSIINEYEEWKKSLLNELEL